MENDTFERFSALDFSSESKAGGEHGIFGTYQEMTAAKTIDIDVQLITSLRAQYPELIVTAVPTGNVNLIQFAAAGHATAEIDLDDETIIKWRGFIPPEQRGGGPGFLADAIFFARYHYRWGQEDFLLYTVRIGPSSVQYVLKEPRGGEHIQGSSRVTDSLVAAVGSWQSIVPDALFVFDGYWFQSPALWKEVQKASWDKVILDPKMKKDLVSVCDTFFDSKETYEEYGVPWKRGLIFYGPPGNGKTISIKALMHSMYQRKARIPCLYVKSAPYTFMIEMIFQLARSQAPCLLVFEDIDTIVTPATRSYFFNEVDGVANNEGIMMVASTNYMERLDPGLTKRPSRFDRKYLFPLPNKDERVLYAQYWQQKLKGNPIEFPDELCPAVADITDGFSFAYLQELFIASLLQLAHPEAEAPDAKDKGDDDLDKYELWRILKRQAAILREEMGSEDGQLSAEQLSPFHEAEPPGQYNSNGAELDLPFPVTTRGTRLPIVTSNRVKHELSSTMQPVEGRRLTPQEALLRLQKMNFVSDKIWQWGPGGN